MHVAIYVCVLCVVFCLLSALLLGSIVQFMHTLHSLFRGQLHPLHYYLKTKDYGGKIRVDVAALDR